MSEETKILQKVLDVLTELNKSADSNKAVEDLADLIRKHPTVTQKQFNELLDATNDISQVNEEVLNNVRDGISEKVFKEVSKLTSKDIIQQLKLTNKVARGKGLSSFLRDSPIKAIMGSFGEGLLNMLPVVGEIRESLKERAEEFNQGISEHVNALKDSYGDVEGKISKDKVKQAILEQTEIEKGRKLKGKERRNIEKQIDKDFKDRALARKKLKATERSERSIFSGSSSELIATDKKILGELEIQNKLTKISEENEERRFNRLHEVDKDSETEAKVGFFSGILGGLSTQLMKPFKALGKAVLFVLTPFRLLTGAIRVLAGVFLLNPIGLAVTALVAGLYFLEKKFGVVSFAIEWWKEKLGISFGGIVDVLLSIKEKFQPVIDFLSTLPKKLIGIVGGALKKIPGSGFISGLFGDEDVDVIPKVTTKPSAKAVINERKVSSLIKKNKKEVVVQPSPAPSVTVTTPGIVGKRINEIPEDITNIALTVFAKGFMIG